MGQGAPLFIKVYPHQLRRDVSAAGISHDFNLEIAAYPDDYVTDHDHLRLSGLAYRLTRAQHPHITGSFVGFIGLKKPRLIKIDREDYLQKTKKLLDANGDEELDDRRFKTLIALGGIFCRDLELRIYRRNNGTIEIRLRGHGLLGKSILTGLQARWLMLGSQPTDAKQPSARRGNPHTR